MVDSGRGKGAGKTLLPATFATDSRKKQAKKEIDIKKIVVFLVGDAGHESVPVSSYRYYVWRKTRKRTTVTSTYFSRLVAEQ